MRASGSRPGRQRAARAARVRAREILAVCAVVAVGWTMSLGMGCCRDSAGGLAGEDGRPAILADTSFLADIVRNVAGERLTVSSLLPTGADPHSFEPTPQDAKRVTESRAIVINVIGLAPQLDDLLADVAGSDVPVIEAAAGLVRASADPHVWLDPLRVVTYVDNIAKGLAELDPAGADEYRANAEAYSEELGALDAWIAGKVETLPVGRRLLVTDHESLGYFAERYGFTIVGSVFPTVSGIGAPSAQQVAALVRDIRSAGAPAIFLRAGSNADLALQIAAETGAEVVTDLYIASVEEDAPTYLEMMRRNVEMIVEALR